ncbi:hypothetical protein [Streptomyces canus]|uniref:hypothetical protein n=1 Tax=Streptomyces canus TaxID=58343 RepID=UPI0036ECFEAC
MEAEFTAGGRIEVVRCADEHDPLPAGATGTVNRWDPHPLVRQLSVDWDAPHAHRRLMLVIADDADAIRLI